LFELGLNFANISLNTTVATVIGFLYKKRVYQLNPEQGWIQEFLLGGALEKIAKNDVCSEN